MSTLWGIFTVLGGLVGLAVLAIAIALLARWWAMGKLRASHYCEFCWKRPADFIVNLDAGEPIGSCEPCLNEKAKPHFREHIEKTGKLRRVHVVNQNRESVRS